MTDTTIVLLGGSGLGPWCWDNVAADLRRTGGNVLLPSLPHQLATTNLQCDLDLSTWIEAVHTVIRVRGASKVVLVAHSFAGYIGAGLLERHPDDLTNVVFVDAVLPEPDSSWFDQAGTDTERFMRSIAHDDAIPFFTREQLDTMFPDHGMNDVQMDQLLSNAVSQPIRTYEQAPITQPIDTSDATLTYVKCSRTPPMAYVTATTPGWRWNEIDTGHWPMITNPTQLANKIREAVADR